MIAQPPQHARGFRMAGRECNMRMRSRRLGVVAGAAVIAAGLAVLPTTASAGAGDTILNPGPFTMTVEGGFMNLAGTLAPLRSSADPARCNDGLNNDDSVNGGDPQDTNIDWDGKLASGVDAQCNGLNNALKAADDSETKTGNQPKVQITISGEVDADGVVDVTNVVIPPEYLFSRTDPVGNPSGGGLVLDITFAADTSGTANGFIDPATGDAELDVTFSMRIVQAFFGIDCTINPISFTLSNDAGSAYNAGPLGVSQSPYNTDNGQVTVSNNIFTIPASQNTDPLSTSNVCTNVIDSGFGVPSASGESAAQFFSISDPIAESGLSAGNTIAGTVTDGVSGLGGIVMTLMDEHDGWNIVDTTITDGSGNYSFSALTAGNYSVRAFDPSGAYQREWKDDALTYKTASVLVVTDAATTNGDMVLGAAPAGGITGRAMDASTNAPIANARVHIFHATDGYVGGLRTGADGYFLMQGLPDGQYFVWYRADTYTSKWHMYKMLFFNADQVTVAGDVAWGSSLL